MTVPNTPTLNPLIRTPRDSADQSTLDTAYYVHTLPQPILYNGRHLLITCEALHGLSRDLNSVAAKNVIARVLSHFTGTGVDFIGLECVGIRWPSNGGEHAVDAGQR